MDLYYHKPDEILFSIFTPRSFYLGAVPSHRLRLVFQDVTSLRDFQQKKVCSYGAKICTFRKVDTEKPRCCIEKISWADRVRNVVSQRVKDERSILHTIK
jgi:hypothetical protein